MLQASREPAIPDVTQLNVALLGPDENRRKVVASAVSKRPGVRIQEFSSFPPRLGELPQRLAQTYEVVIIDADSEPDYAFALAENICSTGRCYVMAYSGSADMKRAVQFMRVGVREFFTLPLDPNEVNAALTRAASYRAEPPPAPHDGKKTGKLFVFLGSKGGCGVTTLASNFALALAEESEKPTLLIDLGQPLGDVAINLGITAEYSIVTALENPNRVDANLLATLVSKHSSGLSILPAPAEIYDVKATSEGVDKLLTVTRDVYDYVVVDIGSRFDLMDSTLFEESSTVFLVTQAGISEMRTANRMVLKFFSKRDENLQIVLNRYKTSDSLFDEAQITKALTRPVQWRIPDDYAAARRTRETAAPMVTTDSNIAQTIREMAKSAAGLLAEKNEKKGFFSFLR
ncbi:MAG TPA: AAA family ATPase [Terracidiphilus sp.]|nr:AAA family ATPase [Terracidiphilus sp.]